MDFGPRESYGSTAGSETVAVLSDFLDTSGLRCAVHTLFLLSASRSASLQTFGPLVFYLLTSLASFTVLLVLARYTQRVLPLSPRSCVYGRGQRAGIRNSLEFSSHAGPPDASNNLSLQAIMALVSETNHLGGFISGEERDEAGQRIGTEKPGQQDLGGEEKK